MPNDTPDVPSLWLAILASLKESVPPKEFQNWIAPIRAEIRENQLRLHLSNPFFSEWIANHYLASIREVAKRLHPTSISVELVSDETNTEQVLHIAETAEGIDEEYASFLIFPPPLILNPRYTFESYVVGPSNQFAHAACRAVANDPANSYNPLFVYGGVGLGKTHLLHAIGWMALKRPEKSRVLYLSADRFMNEMVTAVRLDKLVEFRSRYRDQCDVLLIDDIQSISGKKMTQEEFFHTFNFLHSSNKQIIVTSDRFPQEIPELEERLRSRFQWGLVADIQEPEYETRMAIVTQKAQEEGFRVDSDVAMFLASTIETNIRELEGCMVRLKAYARQAGVDRLTLGLARKALRALFPGHHSFIPLEVIQKTVAEHYGIKLPDLKSDKRNKHILIPRQVAMYLCRKVALASFPEIGEKFGGKDHSTVMNACKRIEKLLLSDKDLLEQVTALENHLQEDA